MYLLCFGYFFIMLNMLYGFNYNIITFILSTVASWIKFIRSVNGMKLIRHSLGFSTLKKFGGWVVVKSLILLSMDLINYPQSKVSMILLLESPLMTEIQFVSLVVTKVWNAQAILAISNFYCLFTIQWLLIYFLNS